MAYQLPTLAGGRKAEGFLTPKTDKIPQKLSIPPRRVLPVIFLPGIMGSNLRMTPERQRELGKRNNVAWNMDRNMDVWRMYRADPQERQLQLDPSTTVVDVYAPSSNPTGNTRESADERHDNVDISCDSPLLRDDPPTARQRRTKTQKARARGWGEIFFSSYGKMLNHFEQQLNAGFVQGKPNQSWHEILGADPAQWNGHGQLPPLTEAELKQIVSDCWLPVHAFGYNWLQSNGESAKAIAKRIDTLISDYHAEGYECEKVIIVTHSMGGLVARALTHPDYGNIRDKVLGIVHGVMPAIGAAAAYRRMRAGFEDAWNDPAADVLGDQGDEVTPILANATGGLELLPSEAYGDGWLQIKQGERVYKTLPQNGDPYAEIYMLKDKWYGLIKGEWVNPAERKKSGFSRTCGYLKKARNFHRAIAHTYHPLTYAHYGADRERKAFKNVVWQIEQRAQFGYDIDQLYIAEDDKQGKIGLQDEFVRGLRVPNQPFTARILPPAEPGDQTVPVHSAEHQLHSGKCQAVFRQTGYEHQGSYKNQNALACTLYSITKIALKVQWPTKRA